MSGFELYGLITVLATVAILLVCLILYARVLRKRHFKCPYCGFSFKAKPTKTFFSSSQGTDKLMLCPNCKKSGYMELKHDADYAPQEEPLRNTQTTEAGQSDNPAKENDDDEKKDS